MTYVLVQVKIEGTRFAKKNNFATLQKVRSGLAGVLPRPKERVSLHTKGLYTGIPQQLNTTYMYNTITCHRVYIYREVHPSAYWVTHVWYAKRSAGIQEHICTSIHWVILCYIMIKVFIMYTKKKRDMHWGVCMYKKIDLMILQVIMCQTSVNKKF